jgi:hypothetical protein
VAAPIPLLEPVIRATVPVSGVVMVDDARGNGRTRSQVMDFRLEVVVLPVSDVDRAEAAHGKYEQESGKPDPDWPAWYARYMADEAAGEGAGK